MLSDMSGSGGLLNCVEITCIKLCSRYLNVVELDNDETPAQCMERIETAIAHDLEIKTTKFTSRDKVCQICIFPPR